MINKEWKKKITDREFINVRFIASNITLYAQEIEKERGNSYRKNEEISGREAHTNT